MLARLAQSVEHETLNLRVVGSSPTSGAICFPFFFPHVFSFFFSSAAVTDLKNEHELNQQHMQSLHRQEVEALKAAHSHTR